MDAYEEIKAAFAEGAKEIEKLRNEKAELEAQNAHALESFATCQKILENVVKQRDAVMEHNALLRAVAEAFHEYDECSGGRCSEELEDCRRKYQAAIDGGALSEESK